MSAKLTSDGKIEQQGDQDGAASGPELAGSSDELAAEDFYFDGPYMVFTAAYHLKRGYCCNSDCRHCPYR